MKFCIIFVSVAFFFALCLLESVDSWTYEQPYTSALKQPDAADPKQEDVPAQEHSHKSMFKLPDPSTLKEPETSEAEQLDNLEALQFHRHLIGKVKCRCPEDFVLVVSTCVSCAEYVKITEEACPVCKN